MDNKIDTSAIVNNQRSMDYLFKEIAIGIVERSEDRFDTDVAEEIERRDSNEG